MNNGSSLQVKRLSNKSSIKTDILLFAVNRCEKLEKRIEKLEKNDENFFKDLVKFCKKHNCDFLKPYYKIVCTHKHNRMLLKELKKDLSYIKLFISLTE